MKCDDALGLCMVIMQMCQDYCEKMKHVALLNNLLKEKF